MFVKRVLKPKPTKETLELACEYVLKGNTLTKTSKVFDIKYSILREYYLRKKKENKDNILPRHVEEEVFDPEQELEVKEMIKKCDTLFYGLTERECRMLVYEMACAFDIDVSESWEQKGVADPNWLKNFQKRHPDVTIEGRYRCAPNNHSVKQLNVYLNTFYENLENKYFTNPKLKDPSRIFCLGEAYTNVKPGDDSNVDKDSKKPLITTCCIFSACGSYIPPVNIYPLKLKNTQVTDYPTGTISLFASKGMLIMSDFIKVMEHFVKHSNSSMENQCILIMDSYIQHLSIEAVKLAEQSGVHLVTVHSHVTKTVLPLDASITGIFKSYYSKGEAMWLADNFQKLPEAKYDNGQIIGEAYVKAMSPLYIENAFFKCGIYPFDRDLFTGKDIEVNQRNIPCADCKVRWELGNLIRINETQVDLERESETLDPEKEEITQETENAEESKTTNQEVTKKLLRPSLKMSPPGAEGLDKLKRRMIRTVARLMKEKKTDDEVWEELSKESGNNCRKLWDRMRMLTLKKLKRLLEAEDRVDHISGFARMTLTDWLLYDMILVHEDIDSAAEEELMSSKVLPMLVAMVKKFDVETATGDALTEAWTSATLYYNSNGYQCSPMMLQRRWYLLKKVTRDKFYKFWFSYRGNTRLLPLINHSAPTELQREVALSFPHVVTEPFPTWEDMIAKRLVVMPDEFQEKLRSMQDTGSPRKKRRNENVPDIIIVEPKVDTICLADSDSETEENSKDTEEKDTEMITETDNEQIPMIVQVKTEKQDSTDVEQAEEPSFYDRIEQYIEREENRIDGELERVGTSNESAPKESTPVDNFDSDSHQSVLIDDDDDETPNTDDHVQDEQQNIDDVENKNTNEREVIDDQQIENIKEENTNTDQIQIDDTDDHLNNTNDNTDHVQIDDADDHLNDTNDNTDHVQIDDADDHLKDTHENTDDIQIGNTVNHQNDNIDEIKHEPNDNIADENAQGMQSPEQMLPVISAITSGEQAKIKTELQQEFTHDKSSDEDDDIIMLDDDDQVKTAPLPINDEIPSSMTFADDGIEFADDGIEYVEDDEDKQENDSEDTQIEKDTKEDQAPPKFDLKLLMNPVVYTTKLDDMSYCNGELIYDTIALKEVLDNIFIESKPVSAKSINVDTAKENIEADVQNEVHNDVQNDDLFHNEMSDDEIDENMKVKPTSYLLQKPRNRSYHPIQICKNPDFNTRLKRLNVGFFSSMRNRMFLKACKPMTVDLSKAFESKLVDGTLYLKKSGLENVQKIVDNVSTVSCSSIVPSAVPVPSLMPQGTTDVDKILQEELKRRMLERNKVINLPHISVVRQINEQLQKAEVAPFMAQTFKHDILQSLAKHHQEPIVIDDPKKSDIQTAVETEKPAEIREDKTLTSTNQTTNVPIVDMNQSKIDINESKIDTNQSTVDTNVSKVDNNVPKVDNNVPKVDNNVPKADSNVPKADKRKYKKQPLNPSWTSKPLIIENYNDEMLLTSDTLYKMLTALDPSCIQKISRMKHQNQQQITDKRTQIENSKDDKGQPEKRAEVIVKETPKIDKTKEKKKEKTVKESMDTKNRPRKKRCCWANYKIDKMIYKLRSYLKHTCRQDECICCCKDKLIIAEQFKYNQRYLNKIHRVESEISYSNRTAPKSGVSIEVQTDPDPNDSTQFTASNPSSEVLVHSDPDKANDDSTQTEFHANVDPNYGLRVYSGIPPKSSQTASKTKTLLKELEPRRARSSKGLICTCQANVSVDKRQRRLVIDASNECPMHNLSKTAQPVVNNTKVYLNRHEIADSSERPYYLGKNKILLTDKKRPVTKVIDPSTLLVPKGVQVILLPNGTITYTVQPGVELTPEEIANMPIILAAIQEQFAGIQMPLTAERLPVSNEIIDLENLKEASQTQDNKDKEASTDPGEKQVDEIVQENNDTNAEVTEIQESTNEAQNNSLAQPDAIKEDNDAANYISAQNIDNHAVPNKSPEMDDDCIVVPSEETAKENSIQETATDVTDLDKDNVANAGTSRNLLSDLMEMSGIVEEDMAPAPEQSVSQPIEPAPVELLPVPQPIEPASVESPLVSALISSANPTPEMPNNVRELHPITSYADLKYSCDNGGHFYKLDLTNGIIVPINVCIQKTSNKKVKPVPTTDAVIDLTDDAGSDMVEVTTSEIMETSDTSITVRETAEEVYDIEDNPSEETVSNSPPAKDFVKSITIYKPSQSSVLKKPNLLKKSIRHLLPGSSSLSPSAQALLNRINALRPLKLLQARQQQYQTNFSVRKRKQSLLKRPLRKAVNLNKIEANIDLVDSDAPMEEEYLVDPSDDSSDDEPLANVAKRMRSEEIESNTSQTISVEDGENTQDTEVLDEELLDGEIQEDVEPRPTQLVLSGNVVPAIMDNFMTDEGADDEDSQEDCILGV